MTRVGCVPAGRASHGHEVARATPRYVPLTGRVPSGAVAAVGLPAFAVALRIEARNGTPGAPEEPAAMASGDSADSAPRRRLTSSLLRSPTLGLRLRALSVQ